MRLLLYTALLLVVLPLQAQLAYSGSVVDAVTGDPLPFVNIGIVDRAIGTVSDEEGSFLLEFRREKVGPADVLRISSLGYEATEIPLSRLEQSTKHFTFRLEPSPIGLDEVIVSTSELFEVEEEVGYPNMMGRGIGYWKDSVALGGELGSRIRVDNGLRRLNALFFQVLDNPSDSVQLRVNIYETDIKSTYPGRNANNSGRSILHTLRKGESLVAIDLSFAEIWVRNDFIISMELLGVYGTERVGLSLPAGPYTGGDSFRRYASQSRWERLKESVMGFSVQTTLYTDNPRRVPKARIVRKREKNETEISGYVFHAGNPLKEATIRNYTRNESVQTDKWGRYTTRISKGDILSVSYPGMLELVLEVEDPRNFNFQLQRNR
ncbi:MAG: carboxypeptidase-like regulatory domain-containing protein [Robiginitalea sp.]|uniref:carboxypeptidase-like regulatory domain-containing protein n=1 Tax=Robiginitalea sp. TaxID=1902411 RepID=UPI003C78F47D